MHQIVLTRGRLLHSVEQIIKNAPLSVPVMVAAPGGKQFAFATTLAGLELELFHCVPLDAARAVVTVRVADCNVSFSTTLLWHRPLYCCWFSSKRRLLEIWDADDIEASHSRLLLPSSCFLHKERNERLTGPGEWVLDEASLRG